MEHLCSLAVGDCDHYESPYLIGVAQAMKRLGHQHAQISIRNRIDQIAAKIDQVRPDVIWTHMLLWPPRGSPPVEELVALMERAARRYGARIILHDGDYKQPTRHPHDISSWCAIALCNHTFDRAAWCVPVLRWPYFAFDQERIADPDPAWACELFFAGQFGRGPVYENRTRFLDVLRKHRLNLRLHDPVTQGNTLMRTAEIAASAEAVLGFGRPDTPGWVDTRVFQYPGAGAVLIHDDVAGYLEPGVHYVPYTTGNADSVAEAMAQLRGMAPAERRMLRERAFAFGQEHHSASVRVRQVLGIVFA